MTTNKNVTDLILPAELKALRDRLGMTQGEFAVALGIKTNHYQRLEYGQTPIRKTVLQAARWVAHQRGVNFDHQTSVK